MAAGSLDQFKRAGVLVSGFTALTMGGFGVCASALIVKQKVSAITKAAVVARGLVVFVSLISIFALIGLLFFIRAFVPGLGPALP